MIKLYKSYIHIPLPQLRFMTFQRPIFAINICHLYIGIENIENSVQLLQAYNFNLILLSDMQIPLTNCLFCRTTKIEISAIIGIEVSGVIQVNELKYRL